MSASLHHSFVSSSLYSGADTNTWVTIATAPTTIEFEDTALERKFILNALIIENSSGGIVKFKINDDNSIYVLDASTVENIDYMEINSITFTTTGTVRWKGLSHRYNKA